MDLGAPGYSGHHVMLHVEEHGGQEVVYVKTPHLLTEEKNVMVLIKK